MTYDMQNTSMCSVGIKLGL